LPPLGLTCVVSRSAVGSDLCASGLGSSLASATIELPHFNNVATAFKRAKCDKLLTK
jgi:hypothetical protein